MLQIDRKIFLKYLIVFLALPKERKKSATQKSVIAEPVFTVKILQSFSGLKCFTTRPSQMCATCQYMLLFRHGRDSLDLLIVMFNIDIRYGGLGK